jgi:hypothetical protein
LGSRPWDWTGYGGVAVIFGFIFALVVVMAAWVTSFLPTTGCGAIDGFPTLPSGFVGSYIDLNLVTTLFATMIGYEIAVFAWRLSRGLYKLLPLT